LHEQLVVLLLNPNKLFEGIILLIEQQIKQYRALNEWFESPLGLAVAKEFTHQFLPVLDYLKGDTLLQLGSCGDNPWLDILSFSHKWVASPFIIDNKVNITTLLDKTPFNRSSVDCVLAPLTMEPFGNGFDLIDEIDRVLTPMGYVVFLSINPWSLWGGALKCGLLSCFAERKIKIRTPFNLNRILLQRGYRQCSLNNFCYVPPVNNASLLKKLNFFNEVGKMIWPFPSGFYCYIAQKYEHISPSIIAQPISEPVIKVYKSPLQPATN
jgi:hypothetical protein